MYYVYLSCYVWYIQYSKLIRGLMCTVIMHCSRIFCRVRTRPRKLECEFVCSRAHTELFVLPNMCTRVCDHLCVRSCDPLPLSPLILVTTIFLSRIMQMTFWDKHFFSPRLLGRCNDSFLRLYSGRSRSQIVGTELGEMLGVAFIMWRSSWWMAFGFSE